jgi:hypothetical protein
MPIPASHRTRTTRSSARPTLSFTSEARSSFKACLTDESFRAGPFLEAKGRIRGRCLSITCAFACRSLGNRRISKLIGRFSPDSATLFLWGRST